MEAWPIMHHSKLIVPATLAVAVLAGCGNDAEPGSGPKESVSRSPDAPVSTALPTTTSGPVSGDTSDSPGSKAPNPATPPKGRPVPKSQLDASGLPKQFPKQAATTDKTVTVTAMEPDACTKSTAKVLKQTNTQVSVQIAQSKPQDRICAQIVRYPKLTVHLAQPLGNRKLVLTAKKPS